MLSNNGAQVKEIFMSQVEDPDYYISTKPIQRETVESDGILLIALRKLLKMHHPLIPPLRLPT